MQSGKYNIEVTSKFEIIEPMFSNNPNLRRLWEQTTRLSFSLILQMQQTKIYARVLKDGFFSFDSVSNTILFGGCRLSSNNPDIDLLTILKDAKIDSIKFLELYTINEGIYRIDKLHPYGKAK